MAEDATYCGRRMDGRVPVGYSSRDRRLLVNKKAEQARRIFELGCVAQLREST